MPTRSAAILLVAHTPDGAYAENDEGYDDDFYDQDDAS